MHQLINFMILWIKNTVTDIYASAKVAILHLLKMQCRKIHLPYDRPLSRTYITTSVFIVAHLTGEIFTLKN